VRVSFSVCSRFQHSRRTATAGPPLHVERSSSGHFPPPRTPEQRINKASVRLSPITPMIGANLTDAYSLFRGAGGGGVPYAPPPPKEPKDPKNSKNS
jgi:hypothetical protein